MKSFFQFLASRNGRILRIAVGALLIILGFFAVNNNVVGVIMIVVGLVPLLAGAFDVCVFAPLFGRPFSGKKIREG